MSTMHMPKSQLQHHKNEAIKKRMSGQTIEEIAVSMGVSVASVHGWVKNVKLTKEQKAKILSVSQEKKSEFYRKKREIALERRKNAQQEGSRRALENDPLHQMGCMLYWGEGDKGDGHISMSNSDSEMMTIFVEFLKRSLSIPDDQICLRIVFHSGNGLSQEEIEGYWLDKLSLPKSSLRKSTNLLSPVGEGKIPYGTAKVYVCGFHYLHHIYGAIAEYCGEDVMSIF